MNDSPGDTARITVTVRADLAAWLRAKARWQQRSMSSLVEDALVDLREEMGEPGEPRRRTRKKAQSSAAGK